MIDISQWNEQDGSIVLLSKQGVCIRHFDRLSLHDRIRQPARSIQGAGSGSGHPQQLTALAGSQLITSACIGGTSGCGIWSFLKQPVHVSPSSGNLGLSPGPTRHWPSQT